MNAQGRTLGAAAQKPAVLTHPFASFVLDNLSALSATLPARAPEPALEPREVVPKPQLSKPLLDDEKKAWVDAIELARPGQQAAAAEHLKMARQAVLGVWDAPPGQCEHAKPHGAFAVGETSCVMAASICGAAWVERVHTSAH